MDRIVPTVAIDKAKATHQNMPNLHAAVANMVRYGNDEKTINAWVKRIVAETTLKMRHEAEAAKKAADALKAAKRDTRK